MYWYEEEVRELERRRATRAPIAKPAVFYGSSTFRLWTNLADDLRDPRALNLAFGGSTLEACAHFFERLVPPENPSTIVLYAGDNDLGDGRPPEHVLDSYRRLADKIRRQLPGVPFSFVSIKPSPARFGIVDRIRRANELVREAAAGYPGAHYISVFEAMLRDGKPRPELYLEDGLHLAPAGYRLWTELLEPWRNTIFMPESEGCNGKTLSSEQSESGISSVVQ